MKKNTKRYRKTKKAKSKNRKYIFLFIILIILLIYLVLNQNKTILTSAASIDDILSVINKNSLAKVSKYIVYGTHLNLEGSLEIAEDEVSDVTVVARKENEEEIEINTTYEYENGKLSFSTLKNINEGVRYSRSDKNDIKNVMIDRFDEAYAELKARFLINCQTEKKDVL